MNNEQLQAAKDQAAMELYDCNYPQAILEGQLNTHTERENFLHRAMEIYAEMRQNNIGYWCIVKYSKGNTPLYYCGYFGKYSGTELLPSISTDFEQAVKCITKQAADNLLANLKKHAPVTSENFVVEEHMYSPKSTEP